MPVLHVATAADATRYPRCFEHGEQYRNYVEPCESHDDPAGCVVTVGCPSGCEAETYHLCES
jgi:hypothetical protein